MIPQHKKRMDRAEKCCAALREYFSQPGMPHQEVLKRLLSWMRVAPNSIKYKPTRKKP